MSDKSFSRDIQRHTNHTLGSWIAEERAMLHGVPKRRQERPLCSMADAFSKIRLGGKVLKLTPTKS